MDCVRPPILAAGAWNRPHSRDVGSAHKLAALHHLTQAGESLPLGQLAERLSCVKSNVTQLVDRLEADGLDSKVVATHWQVAESEVAASVRLSF